MILSFICETHVGGRQKMQLGSRPTVVVRGPSLPLWTPVVVLIPRSEHAGGIREWTVPKLAIAHSRRASSPCVNATRPVYHFGSFDEIFVAAFRLMLLSITHIPAL